MSLRNMCLISLVAAALAGCSSGGGGGATGTSGTTGSAGVAAAVTTGSSSVVADKISIIDTSSAGKAVALPVTQFAATADWNKDKSSTYINDRATGAFNNVNEILCMISQTGYVAMAASTEAAAVPYKALVNKNLCKGNDSTDNANQSQQGDTSASSAPDYATWTVKSFLNASKQLEAHVWIFEKGNPQSQGPDAADKIITAKLVVTKTKDEVPPNGVFRIDFKSYQVTAAGQPDTSKPAIFAGLLESAVNAATGLPEIRFADAETSGKFGEAATVVKTSATSGYGKVSETDSFNGGTPSTFAADFGFDANYFRRKTNDNGTIKDLCFSRSSFETSTWRYGLYKDADGSRFVRNSGVPFNTAADGSGMYGWAGFFGVWAPDTSKITDGMSLYSKDPATGSSLTYTLNIYKGKLKKHTQHTTTLSAIKNIPLEGYMEGSTQYRIIWDGTNLVKTASSPQSTGGPPVWTQLSPAVPLTYTNMQFGGDLNFWSQAMGGQVRIPLQNCSFTPGTPGAPGTTSCSAPSPTSTVVFYTEDIVYPGDTAPGTLTCYNNCPQATTVAGMDPAGSLTYAENFTPGFAGHAYTFASMILKDSGNAGNPLLLATAPTNQPWGFSSGPLVDLTATDTASGKTYAQLLDCGIPNQPQSCGWKAWTLPTFYTWETGPNTWNWLTVVKNGATVVKFEAPARVTYVHSQSDTAAPDYKYNGVSFFLDYNGFGQLNGIPGKCFDPTTGTETLDCSGNKRWVPEFTIPTGSTVSDGTNTFYVKALESEQRMKPVSLSVCTATLPTTVLTLPSSGDAVDPALGPIPATTEVKYIGGVKQGAKTPTKTLSSWFFGL